MCCVNVATIDAITHCVSAPPLMEVWRYSALNAVMRSKYAMEIIFDFYTGLPQLY